MKSKPAKEETAIVDALGEAEVVGELKVVVAMKVPVPVLVSNTAEVVAGRVIAVIESVVFEVAATEVGGTVVALVEGTVVVLVVEETVVVGAMLVVERMVMAEELVEETILARRFFKQAISSLPEICCAKKMTQMTEMMLKFMMSELQI